MKFEYHLEIWIFNIDSKSFSIINLCICLQLCKNVLQFLFPSSKMGYIRINEASRSHEALHFRRVAFLFGKNVHELCQVS